MKFYYYFWALFLVFSCLQEPTDYAALDLEVGKGSVNGASIVVDSGLGSIQRLEDGYLELWLQSPVQTITLDLTGSTQAVWQIVMHNAVAGMTLLNPVAGIDIVENQNGTTYTADINAAVGSSYKLNFSTADYVTADSFSFAALSDIQDAIGSVKDIYDRINSDNSLRFVVSTGDLTSDGTKGEIDRFRNKLSGLNIPFFTSAGNHDTFDDNQKYWRKVFGRTSFTFNYKGIVYIFVDSSLATIEERVYDWLDDWLVVNRSWPQFFIAHYPAIDPSGIRNGGLSSRNEAYKLLAVLLKGDVDIIINGHVHSYYHYNSAGIDSYISGGGGAYPELYDDIGRHYLKITVNGATKEYSVTAVEVDSD